MPKLERDPEHHRKTNKHCFMKTFGCTRQAYEHIPYMTGVTFYNYKHFNFDNNGEPMVACFKHFNEVWAGER